MVKKWLYFSLLNFIVGVDIGLGSNVIDLKEFEEEEGLFDFEEVLYLNLFGV